MSRQVYLQTKHALGIDMAKQRISERFDAATNLWISTVGTATMTWAGNTAQVKAKALAQTVTGLIEVTDDTITITIGLPLIISPFAGAIEVFLKSNADALRP